MVISFKYDNVVGLSLAVLSLQGKLLLISRHSGLDRESVGIVIFIVAHPDKVVGVIVLQISGIVFYLMYYICRLVVM